jgi:hypothetical protein
MMKALLAVNGASVVRGVRFGARAGLKSMQDAYHAVDPFSARENSVERTQLRRIPEKRLVDVIDMPETLLIDPRYVGVSGSTPVQDVAAILALAVTQRPKAALEFGTFYGSGTVNLARNLPQATVHTIDLPPDQDEAQRLIEGRPVDDLYLIESRQLGKAFRGTEFEKRIVQHLGDTAAYDYGQIRDEVSFFLIDGSHTYEYAKSDTLKAFGLAGEKATFVWHDCDDTHPGVTRWLGELVDAQLPVCRIEGTAVACMRAGEGEMREIRRRFVTPASERGTDPGSETGTRAA